MARSVDSSRQVARTRSIALEALDRAGAEEAEASVDIAAVVQQVMHSSYGNALVNAALAGADASALGQAVAGEMASATAGMGAPTAVGLAAAGNSAVAQVLASGALDQGAQAGEMSQAAAINELRGGQGQALPDAVRGRMEKAFGRSFENVRIHVGDRSAAAVAALNAEAVAMGSHIHFAEGFYAPGTQAGDAVIAHELTHVVQAAEGRLPGTGGVSNTGMAAEQEAYGNEALASASSFSTPDATVTERSSFEGASVQFASSVDTGIAPSSFASPMGGLSSLPSLGFGLGGGFGSMGSLAPMGPSTAMGPSAAAPMAAAASAPAMLREADESPAEQEAARETDSEASIRHELAMGLDLGFRRAVDASQDTASIPKEGSGRVDGVFTAPSKGGHLAIEEYMGVMRNIGPDGNATRSGSDDNIRDSARHTQTENDGHVHLDGDHRLGARPETTATPPGGDPVMGGPGGGMREVGEQGSEQGPARDTPVKPVIS